MVCFYTFDCILIVNKNLILGNEGIYYHNISYYKDYILNNIDKDILTKINDSENKVNNDSDSEILNIYTHILNKTRKCKLEINNSIDAMRLNKHITKVPFSTNNKVNKFDITKLSLNV